MGGGLLVPFLITSCIAITLSQSLDLLNCQPSFDKVCERVNCAPLQDCKKGVIVDKGSRCRCCPVCVKLLDEGEPCTPEVRVRANDPGPIPLTKCGLGLKCTNGKCEKDPATKTTCLELQEKRTIIRGQANFNPPKVFRPRKDLWLPDCDAHGNFKIKQCQHGRCFCVDKETGQRTFGQEEVALAVNMTCACASKLADRKKTMNPSEWQTYAQEHCTTSGDFEELQCYKDTCFCVDTATGVPKGDVVKVQQRNLLECYDAKLYRESYLSRCEKQLVTERGILYDFSKKRINIIGLVNVKCDPDGSFANMHCTTSICYCTDREGISFGDYKKDKGGSISDAVMGCRCARDEEDNFRNHARYEQFQCDQWGNFKELQCVEKKCFCLDENGERITEMEPEDQNTDKMPKDCENIRKEVVLTPVVGYSYAEGEEFNSNSWPRQHRSYNIIQHSSVVDTTQVLNSTGN